MANPLAIALALYGGYKGYKAGKERGGTAGGLLGGILGAAGGFYGGQYVGGQLGMSNVAGTQGFTNAMMSPFKAGQAATSANTMTGTIAANSPFAAGQEGARAASQKMMLEKAGQQAGGGFLANLTGGQKAAGLGTLAGLGAYASGAFEPEPYKRAQFTYNVAYPELYRNRKFFVQDPVTGKTVEQEQLDYIPEENQKFVGQDRFGPYGLATKTMNTGGLVSVAKFNEGGMPVKMTHDENDPSNYKRANGSVYDHTSDANKNEDTILAQLADGEFVTRTDGILGAGIVMGADPYNEKEMRKKGAEFFYDQQKKMKRLYDLFNSKKTVN
jgi:hypothetical protein|tara:strand:- start:1664 stop:2647 length:984 start_codon:yes stop_codon:yes gene_type:complete